MWALCDAISKDHVYTFCDGVWEVLTGDSRSLSATEFTEKLQGSLKMRRIFHRLMLLQCMKPGVDAKGKLHSNQEQIISEVHA